MARTYMPGSSSCLGFGKMARKVTMPVLSSTLTSANWSVPGKPVLAAVFKQQAHRRVILIGALERARPQGNA